MKYVYPACFYKEDDGKYSIDFPDFNLATCGDDLKDGIYMAQDALVGRIISHLSDGDQLPTPSNIKDIVPDPEYKDNFEFVTYILADLDSNKVKQNENLIKKTLTIPDWLNTAVENKNINFSGVLKEALINKLTE